MLDLFIDSALDLTRGLPQEAVYSRLLAAIRRLFPADAVALFRAERGALVPVAVDGLAPSVLGKHFVVSEHPRLEKICEAQRPVRFTADDPLPDPFDDELAARFGGVHSCMGCALRVADELVGVLTLDAGAADAFESWDDDPLTLFAALAAAAVRLGGQLESLRIDLDRAQRVAQELSAEALARTGGELVGHSLPMQRLKREIRLVAASDETVLILGETGTGKELVARMIQTLGSRADRPFVYVNCAALPEGLAESEFFGHVKGAYTGAAGQRAGKFELADGGTLVLDEVGELPLSIQPKLLRALQEGELQRVGADRSVRVDVRVIAATNRDLEAEVAAGRFRSDLYHRLAVFPLQVPPLRVRGDDVQLLSEVLLQRACARLGVEHVELAEKARCAMSGYQWPGNVRELEHLLLRAVIRARAESGGGTVVVRQEHLDLRCCSDGAAPMARPTVTAASLQDATDDFQRELIREVVDAAAGNWAAAARRLGVDRSNLHRLAGRLGLRE